MAKWILEGVVTPSAGFEVMVWVVKLYLLGKDEEEQVVVREGERREVRNEEV